MNKMFMRLIYFIVDTLINVRNETSKHHFLKSVKITTYRIYSIKRPTSNKRPPQISATLKVEKFIKRPASNKHPPPKK